MTLSKIVIGDRGRIAQLLPGAGNNQQVRASDLNTVIDYINDLVVVTAETAPVDLTDNSGGTPADTIAVIGATYDQGEVADAVASLATKVNAIITALTNAGILV